MRKTLGASLLIALLLALWATLAVAPAVAQDIPGGVQATDPVEAAPPAQPEPDYIPKALAALARARENADHGNVEDDIYEFMMYAGPEDDNGADVELVDDAFFKKTGTSVGELNDLILRGYAAEAQRHIDAATARGTDPVTADREFAEAVSYALKAHFNLRQLARYYAVPAWMRADWWSRRR